MGMLYLWANVLYVLLYHVVAYRKSVVRGNLRKSFPEQDDAWITSTEKAFYRHLCDVMVEVIKSSSMSRAQLLRSVHYANPELLHRHYLNHRSVVVIMAHTGNWEWIPPLAALIAPQFSQGLYKPLSNKAFDEFFKQTRTRFGSGVIPMERALKVMMEQQREGELTATAFIADQTPSSLSSGVWLKFLNQDTLFFTGTEKIARKLGYAVIYLSMKRNGRGKYTVSMTDICDDASKTEEGYITRNMAALMEADILEQPENWLWSHKRWKHQKADQTRQDVGQTA